MSILVAILVLGGVLAALAGDTLGHRLGKKRVRLFQLRPRHTGRLATSVAGGAIAAVLAPLALWSAGAFVPADPVFVHLPVARRAPVTAAVPPAAPLLPPAKPLAAPVRPNVTPSLTEAAPLLARLKAAEARVATLQSQLATRPRPIAPIVAAAVRPSARLVARQGEVLCLVEVGHLSDDALGQQAVRRVLGLVDQYGQRRGMAGLRVPEAHVAAVASGLQSATGALVRVVAAHHAHSGEPLTVQVSWQPLPAASLATLQERDRLERGPAVSTATLEGALARLEGKETLATVPAAAYVALPDRAATDDDRLRLVWRGDPAQGGPMRLRLDQASE